MNEFFTTEELHDLEGLAPHDPSCASVKRILSRAAKRALAQPEERRCETCAHEELAPNVVPCRDCYRKYCESKAPREHPDWVDHWQARDTPEPGDFECCQGCRLKQASNPAEQPAPEPSEVLVQAIMSGKLFEDQSCRNCVTEPCHWTMEERAYLPPDTLAGSTCPNHRITKPKVPAPAPKPSLADMSAAELKKSILAYVRMRRATGEHQAEAAFADKTLTELARRAAHDAEVTAVLKSLVEAIIEFDNSESIDFQKWLARYKHGLDFAKCCELAGVDHD